MLADGRGGKVAINPICIYTFNQKLDYNRTMAKFILVLLLSTFLILIGGCNRNYVDITIVSDQVDLQADTYTKEFNASQKRSERYVLKEKLIQLRKKQVVMAERIDITTMPNVADSVSEHVSEAERTAQFKKAQTKKDALIAKAEQALLAAEKLQAEPEEAKSTAPSMPTATTK